MPSPRKLSANSIRAITPPGKASVHQKTSIWLAPSLISAPRLARGACTPSPRNERNASWRIIEGTVRVKVTITGPSVLGIRWRNTMARPGVPRLRAASTKSCCLRLITCPRTIRAVSSQPTAPRARNTSSRLLPSIVTRMITRNM